MNKYNKITLFTIFIVLLCVSLGSVSAAGTENTGPTVTANLTSGTYNTTQTAALTANDSSATIYYTNDTTDPRNSSTRITYTQPLTIDKTTTLRYAAEDLAGNWSQLYTQNYVIGNGTINYTNGQSNYTGPQTNSTNWTYNVGGSNADSSIAIGPDGTIYVGTINCATRDGYLYAFKPNGTLKWTYHTGGVTAITIGSNGIIYLKNYSGIEYAFNPNGTLKWNTNETTINSGFTTAGADGTIYLVNKGYLYAYNPDGTLKWTYGTETQYGVRQYKVCGNPVIGSDGTLYIPGTYTLLTQRKDGVVLIMGTIFKIYAINPDGTLKLNYTIGNEPGEPGDVISSGASIGPDGTIYCTTNGGTLYAINPNGTLKWIYETNNIISSCVIGTDGTIYFGTDNPPMLLYALNPNGTLKWTYNTNGGGICSAITIGTDGTIYFGCVSPVQVYGGDSPGFTDLYSLNPNGTVKWTYHAGGVISALTIGPDGTLYVEGRATGVLYAIKDPVPAANFKTNTNQGTGSLTVQFTDNSTGSPTSWNWNFGDDSTSTEQNPTHTYTKPGTYTITLTVTGPGGSNKVVKTSYITVNTPDTTKPTANASVKTGTYNTNKIIKLTMSEKGTIYYTLNGSTPTTSSKKYTGAITISSTTTLKYIAVDTAGNKSPIYTQTYTIDKTAPKVTATNPKSGITGVSRTQTVSIRLSENIVKSVNWSKIYIKNLKTGQKCKATIWISGNHIYIKTSKKAALTWYQIYIPKSAIKDKAGNNLAAIYTWKFKTVKT